MIPYEELCEVLARWRSRNGLENSPSAFVVRPAAATSAAVEPPHEAPADAYEAVDPYAVVGADVAADDGAQAAGVDGWTTPPSAEPDGDGVSDIDLDALVVDEERGS